jgi:hypothetical protein
MLSTNNVTSTGIFTLVGQQGHLLFVWLFKAHPETVLMVTYYEDDILFLSVNFKCSLILHT